MEYAILFYTLFFFYYQDYCFCHLNHDPSVYSIQNVSQAATSWGQYTQPSANITINTVPQTYQPPAYPMGPWRMPIPGMPYHSPAYPVHMPVYRAGIPNWRVPAVPPPGPIALKGPPLLPEEDIYADITDEMIEVWQCQYC